MKTLGERLKAARRHRGLSQGALSAKSGVTQSSISKIERGDQENSTYTLVLADTLHVNHRWLAMGSGSMLDDEEDISRIEGDNISSPVPVTRMLPVISWVRAGILCDSEDPFEPGDAEEWIPAPLPCSDRTFCLKVNGDSMMPEYRDGERIIVDPEVAAVHGEDVVVRTPDGKSTFKRLQITQDGTFLLALNPEYPNRIVEVPEGTHICGVVVASLMTRKK